MGELLKAIPASKGGQPHHGKSTGRDTPTSRKDIANAAGISKDQMVNAIRVNNIPRDIFDAQVESDDPPTIEELARQGTKHIDTLKAGAVSSAWRPIMG